jgi:hypothetical protein
VARSLPHDAVMTATRDRILFLALAAAMLIVAGLVLYAYWPGYMTWDAVRQYREALRNHYDDWHPPAMDWLWRQFHPLHKGPSPMLALQYGLYWAGFLGLVAWALRQGRRGLAIALTVAAILPLPLAMMGAVLKDCLMAGALMATTALLAGVPERRGWALRVPALALLVGAATLRFNALPACLPLAVALLPRDWWRGWKRLAIATLACALVLAAALPVANRLLKAEPSGVGLSLVIFDLSGITYHSGVDVFPDLDVKDPVAVNARCYTPVKWDHYAFWSPTPCPIQFEAIQDAFADSGESPYMHWAKAILAHPVAYTEHRLAHFNINTRFLVHDEVDAPGLVESAPNPWHYGVAANGALSFMERAAFLTGHTPLGWPIWWMAVAAGLLAVSPALPSERLVVPLALSGLLYGLGYLPASVAAELRYHLWTMIATMLAAVLTIDDVVGGARAGRTRTVLAVTPAVVVTLLCLGWRLG